MAESSRIIQEIASLRRDDRLQAALLAVEKALAVSVANPELLNLKAEIKFEIGEKAEAKAILKELVERGPEDDGILNNLAIVLWDEGDSKGALECLARALELNPDNADAAFNHQQFSLRGKEEIVAEILVSVLVSTYGSEKFIRGCLSNLVQQELFLQGRMEILVIDACSPQDEKSIVEEFQAKHANISYERTVQRETIYASWNRAIRASRGSFVINANTDDRFVPEAFSHLARELSEDSSVQAVYGDWMVTKTENDRFDSETDKFVFHYPEYYPPLLLYYQITSPSLMLRRKVFDSIGYYDENYKVFGNSDLMLRFACAGLKAKKVPHLVGLYLESLKSLGHSEPSGQTEWEALYGRYLKPPLFSKLFGFSEIPEAKQFAQFYAILGSWGSNLNSWGGQAMCDFDMSKRFFDEALLFDPDNHLALNDLGVIFCLCGEHRRGVELFRRALPFAQGSSFLEKNLAAGERGSLEFGDFHWIKVQLPQFSSLHDRCLVSAIVSAYNSAAFIRGCLEDLEAQTMADKLEIIVVDSGSLQNERAIVEEFQRTYDNIVYIRTEERETVYQAWNRGAKAAKGKYLTNANTDDRHRSDAFEVMTGILEAEPEVALVYSNQLVTDDADTPFGECRFVGTFQKPGYHRNIMLVGCYMGSQPMWRRSLHGEIGYFDERFVSASDYEFWCRIALSHEMKHIPDLLGVYYRNPRGVEVRDMPLSLKETTKIKGMYADALARIPDDSFLPNVPFRFLLPVGEGEGALEGPLEAYLNAFSSGDPVSLVIMAEENLVSTIEEAVGMVCRKRGLEGDFADIEILLAPGSDDFGLESFDALIPMPNTSAEILEKARSLDMPVLAPLSERLKAAFGGWNPMAIDIVLLTHNRLKYLEKTVDTLFERTRFPFRLTIVDNASDPDALAYLEANRERFHRVIRNPENRWTGAFTQGIALTRSDPFIVSDPDILVPEGEPCWLTRMIELMVVCPEMGMLALNLDPANKPANLPDVYLSEKTFYGPDITLSYVGTVMQTIRRKFFDLPYTTDWETVEAIRRRGGLVGFANHILAYHLGWDEETDYPEHLVEKYRYFKENYGSDVYKKYTENSSILAAMDRSVPSAEASRSYYRYARPEVQKLVPLGAKKILDVGCAAGNLGRALKERQDCHVTGIEISSMVAAEAKNFLDEVRVGDAGEVLSRLPSGNFDCIVFADVLEHLIDPEGCLVQAKRLLAPGGTVVASIPNVRHWSVVKDLLEGRWDYQDAGILDRTHLRFFTRNSLVQMFNGAGFLIETASGTVLDGFDVPEGVVSGLASVGIDTSSLQNEGQIYQFLVATAPESSHTSIVILTLNQLEHTRKCVESLYRHTTLPFELVFVDNGSSDGTVAYLKSLAEEKSNVKLIRNQGNRGFPAGCNQGIAVSTGRYVVLLNNDVVVAQGWLEGMIKAANSSPGVGLVGPMTNCANGTQNVAEISYDPETLEGFEAFARSWQKRLLDRVHEEHRVIGFCMLIRREVIDQIGGLDSSFGTGNFEDDDYCMRALVAGFRILFAEEVFVHHFGNTTFKGEKIDCDATVLGNWNLFKDKWRLSADLGCREGYEVAEILAQAFEPAIHAEPLFSRGLSSLELPYSRAFNFLLADADERTIRDAVSSFLRAFQAGSDVALHVLCGKEIEKIQEIVESVIEGLGLDSENIPDVSLLAAPDSPLELPRYVLAADAVLGSRRVLMGARDLGIPALFGADPEEMRALLSEKPGVPR